MKQRGRKSAASMLVRPRPIEVVERQRPPHDLTDEEVEIWAAVTGAMPADWFSPATVPVLAQYCRHVIHARRVGELIERMTGDPEFSVEEYDRLLKMQERESRAISSLATKMRLTQQATTNHRGNKRPIQAITPPWDF